MKIFFYWKNSPVDCERFQNVVDTFHFDGEKMIFNSIDGLWDRLRAEMNNDIIVVILAVDNTELAEVHSLRSFLHDFRLILILPDLDDSTISKGFECYPRFVSYINSDFTDVISVLNKMIEISSKVR